MIYPKKQLGKLDSGILSQYILYKVGPMSHLKLQKLLYYIQALHLAYFESEIIDDEFEAWLHGPVSRYVYNQLKDKSILYSELYYEQEKNEPSPKEILEKQLLSDQIELIDEVLEKYGKLRSSQLESLTHSESPWIEARKGYGVADKCNEVIPKSVMLEYYKNQVYGESAKS